MILLFFSMLLSMSFKTMPRTTIKLNDAVRPTQRRTLCDACPMLSAEQPLTPHTSRLARGLALTQSYDLLLSADCADDRVRAFCSDGLLPPITVK